MWTRRKRVRGEYKYQESFAYHQYPIPTRICDSSPSSRNFLSLNRTMSTSIPSIDQGGGTVVPITGFYQPSFILPYQVTLFTQGFWSIQLPTAQDVTRRVNIPSAVLCTGLTLTVFSTCLMMNVRRPAFVFGHRAFNDMGGYSDFVNATAVSLAGIRPGSFIVPSLVSFITNHLWAASEPSSSGPNSKAQEVTFTWLGGF